MFAICTYKYLRLRLQPMFALALRTVMLHNTPLFPHRILPLANVHNQVKQLFHNNIKKVKFYVVVYIQGQISCVSSNLYSCKCALL